jgi:hypothetical protein
MKNKFKLSAAFFCISVLLFSCTKDVNNPNLANTIKVNSTPIASEPEAIKAYIVIVKANRDSIQSNIVLVE